ncbi:MAG: DUF4838 domain-containing protein [Lentisphaerae bacterium]|jgi:hypothetical protein|nr:DUF4838 domain-containing protein [Lentisphaerota bacterium]
MNRKPHLHWIPLMGLIAIAGTLEARQLARDGQPTAEILIATNAQTTEIYAANELQHWLEKVSGARLPIVTRPGKPAPATRLVIGGGLAGDFAADLKALAGRDGYAIREKTASNEIFIFGAIPRGTLNGVYAFIEANTDLIWPRPDPAVGAVYSVNPNLAVSVADRIDIPKSTLRGWGWTVSGFKHEPAWASRNRLNWLGYYSATNLVMGSQYNPAGGGHGLKLYMKPDQYFEKHPEYFPFIGGKRVKTGQLCFMAHEMIPTYVANLRADLDAKPGSDGVNISITDGCGVCDCPRCLAPLTLEDGTRIEPTDEAFRSTQFYLFLNKIARELHKTHPDTIILTYAYLFTVVPQPVRLEPNIRVMFCPFAKDHKFPIHDAARNARIRDQAIGWGKVTDKTWLREYYGCAADFPRPIEFTVKEDLLFCLTNGIHEFHSELPVDKPHKANPSHVWDASAMTMWVISRLWWNPEQDVSTLRNEYIRRTYREAGRPMHSYFSLIRRSWFASSFPAVYSDDANSMGRMYIFEAGIEDSCRKLLEEAERLAKHPVSLELIRRHRARFEEWMKFSRTDKTVRANVPYVENAARLDFADEAWKRAGNADNFKICAGVQKGSNALFQTDVQLLHDSRNLCLRTTAYARDMATLEGSPLREDGSETFPRGDHIELFLADSRTGDYYQFAFDVGNKAVYEGKGYDGSWSTTWTRRVARYPDRWEMLVTIPLEAIGCSLTENNKLRFLAYRSKYYTDGTTDKQGRPITLREQSSWGGGFVHQATSFGELTLQQR